MATEDMIDDLLSRALEHSSENENFLDPQCPDAQDLAGYLEGRLASHEAQQMEAHFSQCAECRHSLIAVREAMTEPFRKPIPRACVREAKGLVKPSLLFGIRDFFVSITNELIASTRKLAISTLTVPKLVPVGVVASAFIAYIYFVASGPAAKVEFMSVPHSHGMDRTAAFSPTDQSFQVTDPHLVKSGDMFRIKTALSKDGYLYVLLRYNTGKIEQLHPLSDPKMLTKGTSVDLPWEGGSYSFLEAMERIYVLVSGQPIQNAARLLNELGFQETELAASGRFSFIEVLDLGSRQNPG